MLTLNSGPRLKPYHTPHLNKSRLKPHIGPLDYMRDLRKRLQCKPFKWFLENVFPEMFIPYNEFKMVAKGEVRNVATDACMDTLGSTSLGTYLTLFRSLMIFSIYVGQYAA